MAQYPIPQFIESEGKIISFLTFRQFFILIGGGAVCFILYYLLPSSLFMIVAIIIALITAAIAFLKVDNLTIVGFIYNSIIFMMGSKNYVWKRKESPYPYRVKKNQDIQNIQEFSAAEGSLRKLGDAKKIVEYRKK